jgi:hypothetical protein
VAAGVAALAVAWLLAADALSATILPAGLRLPTGAAEATFDPRAAARARDFEALVRWLRVATELTTILVLAFYARYGARLTSE